MNIKDSGERTEFVSGAVRDLSEGKGRFDLMPLQVLSKYGMSKIFLFLATFLETRNTISLYDALGLFCHEAYDNDHETMFLEVAKHYEAGAKKYEEHNWQKGIPVSSYIDSAARHYLKWKRGDQDEPHDRAFVWNILCCIWEVDYHEYNSEDEA